MCGIVGLISKKNFGFDYTAKELFTDELRMNSIRGVDSTGAFGINKDGKLDVIKGDTNAWQFVTCKNYQEFEAKISQQYHIVIGHNRAATKGTITAANAHPFKEDNICLVHNGTIYNQEALDKNVDVDSHAIAKALTKADAKTALNLIHGPFALVWYDSKQRTLNLARNDDRPLFILEYEDFWNISSEPGLPYWLNGRANRKIVGIPMLIPTEKILRFELDELQKGYTEVAFDNYEYTPPVVQYSLPYRAPQNHLHVIKDQNIYPVKCGDELVFKVDDMKFDDRIYTIFGHPIFNGEVDENILVKLSKTFKTDVDALVSAGYGIGNVSSISTVGSMTVFILSFAAPHHIHIDANNNKTTDQEIKEAIAKGCGRCKEVMSFVDIASSIVRKKKDGTYRLLCKKCLNESLAQIPKGPLLAN